MRHHHGQDHRTGDRGHQGRRGRGGWDDIFGPDGPFGSDGPFGPHGPFGKNGPFGDHGAFGRFAASLGGEGYGDGDGHPDGLGRGRGGRRRKRFDSEELRLVMLKLITDEPRHGYELIRAIEELSGGAYAPSPGLIYPTLTLLADMGQVEEQPGSGARKSFAITDAGRAELEANAAMLSEALNRLELMADRHRTAAPSPAWRAMRNLGMVLRNQMLHHRDDKAHLQKIIDIIDDAARRIEQL